MVNISTLERLDCSLSATVTGQLNARKNEFQMMPEAATKALAMVKDPSCEIGLVARTIERDVKLAASIMSVANSAIYSPGRPIAVVRDAVIHVGFHQCQNLIHACCAKSLMQSVKIEPESARDALLHHSLTTAAIASALNERMGLGYQGEEFTAGLLHDLGRLLLGALFPEEFCALNEIHALESPESLAQEQDIVGTDHCAVGCFFAVVNRLPDPLAEAVRFHHTPERATFDPRLTATIAVADHLATLAMAGTASSCDLPSDPRWKALEAHVETTQAAKLTETLEEIFEQAAACVSSLSTPAMSS